MSYNITAWRTKEIDGLRFRLTDAMEMMPKDMIDRGYEPPVLTCEAHMEVPTQITSPLQIIPFVDVESPATIRVAGDCLVMNGKIDAEGVFWVNALGMTGEGSGHVCEFYLMPLLAKSSGKLRARLVWEGGDSIEKLRVVDGMIKSKNLE